jgi:hypothetical protein
MLVAAAHCRAGAGSATASCHCGLPGPARRASVRSSKKRIALDIRRRHDYLLLGAVLNFFRSGPAHRPRQPLEAVKHARAQRHRLGAGDRFHLGVAQDPGTRPAQSLPSDRSAGVQRLEHAGDLFLLLQIVGRPRRHLVRIAADMSMPSRFNSVMLRMGLRFRRRD